MTPGRLLIALFLSLLAPDASAALKISGSTRFQFSNETANVAFGCDRITNPSREDATGTVSLRLWARDAPRNGGAISGKIVGDFKIVASLSPSKPTTFP